MLDATDPTDILEARPESPVAEVGSVVIRFAGDSGDGMQLTGSSLAETSALFGNDIATLPDFPAEIRAPAGTVAGVSAFQLHFASQDIKTPGDQLNALVAMNAAALKSNIGDLEEGGILVIDKAGFGPADLKKAGYEASPLDDGSLSKFRVIPLEITARTLEAVKAAGLKGKEAERCKNTYTLGIMDWLYDRPLESTLAGFAAKFKGKPELAEANRLALQAGYNYANTVELFTTHYRIRQAKFSPGTYRQVNGNQAMALGVAAAARQSGRKVFYGSYPITPASDILHELSKLKHFNIITFQAEDEIAAIASALGASWAGELGVTCSSGPGIALKSEAMNLAVMAELPLIVIDVQRGGPSTGLPTKTEQADLLQALFGRNGDSPMPVVAASTPGDCFYAFYEAARVAVKYMTPVVVLSDGYLGNGTEPWLVPQVGGLPAFPGPWGLEPGTYKPYLRQEGTHSRPWASLGTPGLVHRLTGIEHSGVSGQISYEPDNHHKMTLERQQKVAAIAQELPPLKVAGAQQGELLVVSWGGTYGSVSTAFEAMAKGNPGLGHLHLRWLNPLPPDLGGILKRYKKVLVPEINTGQLRLYLSGTYGIPVQGFNVVRGKPLRVQGLCEEFTRLLKEA
jgi:2-oxoglutarate ferredoxin oxidoreductase subunit alpha